MALLNLTSKVICKLAWEKSKISYLQNYISSDIRSDLIPIGSSWKIFAHTKFSQTEIKGLFLEGVWLICFEA